MKYKSLNFITNYLIEIINKESDIILTKISEDFDLDYNLLKTKYLNSDNITKNTISNINNNLNDDDDNIIDELDFENNNIEKSTSIDNCNICISVDDIKKNVKNTIDCKIRCLGVIKSGAQCARTRKNDSEFCLIHQKSLKFGKIHNINQK